MSAIYLFLAEGFEIIEAFTTVDICRRAGIEIQTVSVTGESMVTSSHQIMVKADVLLEEVDFETAQMLVLPGGMPGTKNLEACEELLEQIKKFYQQGKQIGAICAAPSILGHLGILQGKRACAFPEFEKDLIGAFVTQQEVEVDGTILTSRGMGTSLPFALAIATTFVGEERAKEIASKVQYQKEVI